MFLKGLRTTGERAGMEALGNTKFDRWVLECLGLGLGSRRRIVFLFPESGPRVGYKFLEAS